MNAAISISNLKKTYPRRWASPPFEALKGISLSVEAGETFGFVGPNGAGKSTTIKILTGVMAPSAGTASLFGIDVSDPESRRGLGYVPENPSLPDYLTPFEILSMGLELHRRRTANARMHCLEWLERFGLADVANKVVRGFSKGMAQRTALAHAMAVEPRLLILDEPLSGLDPIGRREVVDILSEYRQHGGTIFLTSHVLHDVERLADRFGLIHKGELRAVRTPGEVVGEDDRVLVRSAGAGTAEAEVLAGMRAEPGGRWVIEVHRTRLWDTLHALESAGHSLIEIKPTLSLETAFLSVVKGA
ncbi:MAG: ABC transporter ATP-binding protein [Burkholderiaceae bacterium]|nr:ABC transporter ATP-binding protein [Sulfuritalea sp.]MCF8176095.1 ABC transporter ATP-binding protein [Burkholderiaceae bacterium]MCF8184888.1 ABC transporter ATP-binding protein [Polynucleobacter sp.]